jgi:micrococcal nuclease
MKYAFLFSFLIPLGIMTVLVSTVSNSLFSFTPEEESVLEKAQQSLDERNNLNTTVVLPSPTIAEGIEISGPVTYVVDGDTLDVNDIRIRLALVNTPEEGKPGFDSAKDFVEKLCLTKNGQVDIDDGQRQGSFGREIGVVYCVGINLNQALMDKSMAAIDTDFCEVSEFANETWAVSDC